MQKREDSGEGGCRSPRRDRRGKGERKVTRDYLRNAAFHYLERYASSEANLQRVLHNKVRRRTAQSPLAAETAAEVAAWIEETVRACRDLGLVNDRLYAESRVRALIRGGNSRVKIIQKLKGKGIAPALAEEVMSTLQREMPAAELLAAVKYIRRRRFGAFSPAPPDPVPGDPGPRDAERTEKQMAAMARAGFSFDLARKVLQESREDLEEILYEEGSAGIQGKF